MTRKKRLPSGDPQHLIQLERPNQSWFLDFMSDSFAGGRPFRTLNILDDFNREVVCIEIDTSLPAERVIRALETAAIGRSLPKQIRMDNGPELISGALARWSK